MVSPLFASGKTLILKPGKKPFFVEKSMNIKVFA